MTFPINNPVIYERSADGSLVPLPTAGPALEALLAEQATLKAKRIAAAVAERARDVAEHKKQLEEARLERGRAELDAFEAKAKAAWKANGGSSSDFGTEWPRIKADYLRAKVAAHATGDPLVAANIEKLRESGAYGRL